MHRIVAGGSGLVGFELVLHWLKQNYRVTVVGRDKKKIFAEFGNRVRALEWIELSADDMRDADVIVNLAGAGIAEKRWNAKRKQEILQSRVDTTRLIVSLLETLGEKAPMLLNASAIGVYGLQPSVASGLPPRLDENTPINFDVAPDFLAKVGREWEKATWPAKQKDLRVVNLRFGVVLSNKGGALPQMARPFYFGMGGRVGSGDQPISWVTLSDLVRAIDFIVTHKNLSGPINIVAPGCVAQRDFAKTLGEVLHRPSIMPLPKFVVEWVFGEMGRELLLEGQHVFPKHLLDAGFTFESSDIKAGLIKALQK